MNKRFAINLFLVFSLVLSGCDRFKETEEEVEEKAPPNVIQLAPEAVRTAGIKTVTVESQTVTSPLVATAEIKANENRIFHINSFVTGRVIQDNVLLGDTIQAGQVLAMVQNLDVAKIQADYIHELHQNEVEIKKAQTRFALAQKNLERERRLLAEGISPRKDYQQAETDVALARSDLEGETEHRIHIKAEGRALLSAYGMKPGNVHSEFIRTGTPVTAPRSGIVTKKNVTTGDMVTPEMVMVEVADLSQVWLDITVYPKDLSRIQKGQSIRFTTDSLPGKQFVGTINYIQPATEESSQTYVARAFLNNSESLLRPGMFGQVQIEQTLSQTKAFVPEIAVQQYGRESFVFVPLKKNRFRKQTVILGNKVDSGYVVNQGLSPGDRVVGQGSFTLKAEMLKSQFAEEE